MIQLVIAVVFISIVGVYLSWKQRHRYWEKRQVPHLKSRSLLYGNYGDVFLGKIAVAENIQKIYNILAPHRFGGIYLYSKPVLVIRDPELVKMIMIKDFHCFHDRGLDAVNENEFDPLSLNLFFRTGKDWDLMRRKLTPTFTTSKIKMMFELVLKVAGNLEKFVENSVLNQETIDMKDLMARYGIDVISSCAFGLEADSLNNPNSEFREKGKIIFASPLKRRIYEFLLNTSPTLLRASRISRHQPKVKDFFVNLVNDTVKYRKENGVVRNDFLDLLMTVEEDETEEMKNFDLDLAAQCIGFFIAGFDTSSNALSSIFYELAENPHVQKELQEEIDRVLGLYDGKITYESLNQMTFMEKVFNETARLYPATSILERLCTVDYRFPNSDFVLEKGTMVFIPVQGLHRDPQYYPNPNVFNPENFSKEAKDSRPGCTFLPFGEGPRNCIGSRFGLMQVKLAITTIMRKYTVTVSPKMKLPLELRLYSISTSWKNPIFLNFTKRRE